MAISKSRNGEWTDARWKSFVVSVLRSGTRRYPPKYETLNAAKTEKKVNAKTGRIAQHYKCAVCLSTFPAKDVQVDHIDPVVCLKKGFVDWDTYIKRMYVAADGLQVLCKPCHLIKSNEERKQRKKK